MFGLVSEWQQVLQGRGFGNCLLVVCEYVVFNWFYVLLMWNVLVNVCCGVILLLCNWGSWCIIMLILICVFGVSVVIGLLSRLVSIVGVILIRMNWFWIKCLVLLLLLLWQCIVLFGLRVKMFVLVIILVLWWVVVVVRVEVIDFMLLIGMCQILVFLLIR